MPGAGRDSRRAHRPSYPSSPSPLFLPLGGGCREATSGGGSSPAQRRSASGGGASARHLPTGGVVPGSPTRSVLGARPSPRTSEKFLGGAGPESGPKAWSPGPGARPSPRTSEKFLGGAGPESGPKALGEARDWPMFVSVATTKCQWSASSVLWNLLESAAYLAGSVSWVELVLGTRIAV